MEIESWKDFGYWQLPPNCIRVTGQSTHELTYEGMAVNIQDIIRADRASLHKEISAKLMEVRKKWGHITRDYRDTDKIQDEIRKAIDEVFSSKE